MYGVFHISIFKRGKLVYEGIENKPQEAQIPTVDLFEECAYHIRERSLEFVHLLGTMMNINVDGV